MAEPAQPLDINTLHNVHAVEELKKKKTEQKAEQTHNLLVSTLVFVRES